MLNLKYALVWGFFSLKKKKKKKKKNMKIIYFHNDLIWVPLQLLYCGAVVKHRIWDQEVDQEVVGSILTTTKCCVLEQDTLFTLHSTDFYSGRRGPHGRLVLVY